MAEGRQKIGGSRSERAGPENGPKHNRRTNFNYGQKLNRYMSEENPILYAVILFDNSVL